MLKLIIMILIDVQLKILLKPINNCPFIPKFLENFFKYNHKILYFYNIFIGNAEYQQFSKKEP